MTGCKRGICKACKDRVPARSIIDDWTLYSFNACENRIVTNADIKQVSGPVTRLRR